MSLLLIILKSMAIGVLGSVPVGPIVMLAVQRCLSSGWKAGLRCSTGAILSDTVFAAMAMFAVKTTSDLLQKHSIAIQVCGGLIIALTGIGMLLRRSTLNKKETRYNSMTDAAQSIAMGFTNPGSFFWVLGALTAMGIGRDSISIAESILVISGVFAGSMGYWLLLTYLASRKGGKFSVRTLNRINKYFGAAILLFGLFFIAIGLAKLYCQ